MSVLSSWNSTLFEHSYVTIKFDAYFFHVKVELYFSKCIFSFFKFYFLCIIQPTWDLSMFRPSHLNEKSQPENHFLRTAALSINTFALGKYCADIAMKIWKEIMNTHTNIYFPTPTPFWNSKDHSVIFETSFLNLVTSLRISFRNVHGNMGHLILSEILPDCAVYNFQ